ncbi:MAG: hypothetical protein IH994_09315 [Proteobacteria bacterium]|nr:hypothetical protein [Pseudomonadota bacterium]
MSFKKTLHRVSRLGAGFGSLAVGLMLLATSIASGAEIKCDKFDVMAELRGDQVWVSVDTDCPNFTGIMVGVSRVYYERGNDAAYSHSYLEEKSTVGSWRKPRQISVVHSKWNTMVKAHREKMSRLGMGYTVGRVDDDLEMSMVVPVNQKDRRFGKRNENLVGKAVRTTGLRVIISEVKIRYPVHASAGQAHLPSTDPYSLELKRAYRVSKETPLMSMLNPSDPMAALKQVKYIPAGYVIKILSASKMHGNPWYRVSVTNQNGISVGSGWVNSTALLGQELHAVK